MADAGIVAPGPPSALLAQIGLLLGKRKSRAVKISLAALAGAYIAYRAAKEVQKRPRSLSGRSGGGGVGGAGRWGLSPEPGPLGSRASQDLPARSTGASTAITLAHERHACMHACVCVRVRVRWGGMDVQPPRRQCSLVVPWLPGRSPGPVPARMHAPVQTRTGP